MPAPDHLRRQRTWQTWKPLLYCLRILRELEPAILISVSLFAYNDSLWAARHGASYVFETTQPSKSSLLDKSAWHFAITNGETDPITGSPFWQDVDKMDVYANTDVYAGMTSWPEPKLKWADAETDDLWCLVYAAASSPHVDYAPIRQPNGTCGALPALVASWCNGWKTSVWVGDGKTFPTEDPGWRCLVPSNWPPTEEGRCYSICLDISGEESHTPPKLSIDFVFLLLLPIIFDLWFILTWIHHKGLFEGFEQRVKLGAKIVFVVVSCGLAFTGVMLIAHTDQIVGTVAPRDSYGPILAILLAFFWALYFFNLAAEDDVPFVKRLMTPWMTLQKRMLGLKSSEKGGCKHPLTGDTSLCFFLAEGYKSRFNVYKRGALAVLLLIFLVQRTFSSTGWVAEYAKYNESFYDPFEFLSGQYIVLILLLVKIAQSLKPPPITVDFNVCHETRALDPDPTLKSELFNILSGSAEVVKQEACHFVGDFEIADGDRTLTLRKATAKRSPDGLTQSL